MPNIGMSKLIDNNKEKTIKATNVVDKGMLKEGDACFLQITIDMNKL